MSRFRYTDGEGYVRNDNRESGGFLFEDGILSCAHCSAAIHRSDIEKPKTGLTMRARCWSCDEDLCPECGFETYMYGHDHPNHPRTWSHQMWLDRKMNEIHRRRQNAKLLGV